MRALIVASLRGATGNATTAGKLAGILRHAGYAVTLADVGDAAAALARWVDGGSGDGGATDDGDSRLPRQVVVGVHAYRAGAAIDPARLPPGVTYICVLGGTDMNEDIAPGAPAAKVAVIARSVRGAAAIVAFGPPLRDALLAWLPTVVPDADERTRVTARITVIPQGFDAAAVVAACPSHHGSTVPPPPPPPGGLHATLGVPVEDRIVLLPAGLRPVKDPLWLAASVPRLAAAAACAVHLVIVGPPLDAGTAAAVAAASGCDPALMSSPPPAVPASYGGRGGVWYHPPVVQTTLWRWMCEADVVANTSRSEGQCNAILEAQAARCPVIARANAGNAALIAHGVTGWLAATPAEWEAAAVPILSAPGDTSASRRAATAHVTAAAAAALTAHFSAAAEATAWHALLSRLAPPSP